MNVVSAVVGKLNTNCYTLCDENTKSCAIIDPGADSEKIINLVETTDCRPTAILLTHGHADHTGAVADLQKKYCISVYLGENEPQGYQTIFPKLENVSYYGEGDIIKVGSLEVLVLATPGHSIGSVTLQVENALFTGDTLFRRDCGSTQYYTGNLMQLFSSLRRIGSQRGNYTVFPGHMETTCLDDEREKNVGLHYVLTR